MNGGCKVSGQRIGFIHARLGQAQTGRNHNRNPAQSAPPEILAKMVFCARAGRVLLEMHKPRQPGDHFESKFFQHRLNATAQDL